MRVIHTAQKVPLILRPEAKLANTTAANSSYQRGLFV